MKLKTTVTACIAGMAMLSTAPTFAASPTLDEVKARGIIQCVVNPGLPGFAAPDDKGIWRGFDIDLCRALAAAIFNDPTKAAFKPGV